MAGREKVTVVYPHIQLFFTGALHQKQWCSGASIQEGKETMACNAQNTACVSSYPLITPVVQSTFHEDGQPLNVIQ